MNACDTNQQNKLRVLFLDKDGVLNSRNWESERGKFTQGMLRPPENFHRGQPDDIRRALWDLDPKAMETLHKIVTDYKFKVVISSGDRIGESIGYFEKLFRLRGCDFPEGTIIDMTPSMGPDASRGDEIEAWLQSADPCQYLIIDDRADMHFHHKRHLIQTDPQIGLQPWHHEIAGIHLQRDWV